MNTILYKITNGKPGFWLMRDVPEDPKIKSTLYNKWHTETVEQCKANALEIINAMDEVGNLLSPFTHWFNTAKDGDTFDLEGLEFKREFKNDCRDVHGDCQLTGEQYRIGCQHRCKKEIEVIRLIPKTETQDELWNEVKKLWPTYRYSIEDMLDAYEELKSKFTIKRNP